MYKLLREEASDPGTRPERLEELWCSVDPEVRLLVAKNPSSPPELLAEIAKDPTANEELYLAVGANPNTPLSVLYKVWQRAPKGFLENPVVTLLQLESPQFWSELPSQTLVALLSLPNIDPVALRWAVKRRDSAVSSAVIKHPATEESLLETIFSRDAYQNWIRQELARSPRVSAARLEFLLGDAVLEVRQAALHNPTLAPELRALGPKLPQLFTKEKGPPRYPLSAEELCHLARCGDAAKDFVLAHPDCPKEVLALLALGPLHPLSQAMSKENPALSKIGGAIPRARILRVCLHPKADEALLAALAAHGSSEVRTHAAKNPCLSAALASQLADDHTHEVREAIAEHPALPGELVALLSQDKSWRVRHNAAKNPSLPQEAFAALAKDKQPMVRRAVAQHPNTPPALLAILLGDEAPEVRAAAQAHPNRPLEELLRYQKLSAPETPEAELVSLADGGPYAKELLFQNPSAPLWLLERFATSSDLKERALAAACPRLGPSFLEALASDPSIEVRLALARNPAAPTHLLQAFADSRQTAFLRALAQNPALSEALFAFLFQENPTATRLEIAKNPAAPRAILLQLVEAAYSQNTPELLRVIAAHPNAPLETFQKLGGKCAELALQNKELRALFSEKPEQVGGLHPGLIWGLLQQEKLPEGMLRVIAQSQSFNTQHALALCPRTPPDILLALLQSPHSQVQQALKRNPAAKGLLSPKG